MISHPTSFVPAARVSASGGASRWPAIAGPTAIRDALATPDPRPTIFNPAAITAASAGTSTAATIQEPTARVAASRRVDQRPTRVPPIAKNSASAAASTHPAIDRAIAIPGPSGGVGDGQPANQTANAKPDPLAASGLAAASHPGHDSEHLPPLAVATLDTHPTSIRSTAIRAASGGVDTAATKRDAPANPTPSRRPNSRPAKPGPKANVPALGGATPAANHGALASDPAPPGVPGQPGRAPTSAIRLSLVDPVLTLAADVLDDLEKVAVAQANRLRQMTRTEPDADGITRGLGFDESHPDVAKVAAMVAMLHCGPQRRRPRLLADGTKLPCCLLHEAERTLERQLRKHPLYPWVESIRGVGDKQAARLLAALGDPYIRPEWSRTYTATFDGVWSVQLRGFGPANTVHARTLPDLAEEVERRTDPFDRGVRGTLAVEKDADVAELTLTMPEGPRTLRALYAYAGMHVLPVSDHTRCESQVASVAGGGKPPGDYGPADSQPRCVAGAGGGDTSQTNPARHGPHAGVAPHRARGQQGNWAETLRKRLWLVAESCRRQVVAPCVGKLNSEDGVAHHVDECQCSPYRVLYDDSRARYADAVHLVACVRCGPRGKPAPVGSPLSDGHQDARAQRVVMRAVLAGLWRAAKAHHEQHGTDDAALAIVAALVGAVLQPGERS